MRWTWGAAPAHPRSEKKWRSSLDWLDRRTLLAASLTQAASVAMGKSREARIERDVIYRDVPGDREALDIYRPRGPAPEGGRPVILAIHGGGWARYNKAQYGPAVAPLTRKGFLVIVPNYRLSKPGEPSWPTNFEGIRDAVRWVRLHAKDLGADPDRIAAMGESAGGHLAELLGTYPDEPVNPDGPPWDSDARNSVDAISARVEAVVSFYGPSDLADLDARSPLASGRIRRFLGASPDRAPGRYEAASPINHVTPDDPPMLLIHGSADTLVSPSQSVAMKRKLNSEGVPARLVIVPGAPHGFGLHTSGRDLGRLIARFLQRSMG